MEIVFNLGTDSYLDAAKSLDKIMMNKNVVTYISEKEYFSLYRCGIN